MKGLKFLGIQPIYSGRSKEMKMNGVELNGR